jgi:hypothetical protein
MASKIVYTLAAILILSFLIGGVPFLTWMMGAVVIASTLGLFIYFLFFV